VAAFDTSAQWINQIYTLNGPQDVRAVSTRVSTIQLGDGTDFYEPLNAADLAFLLAEQLSHPDFLGPGERRDRPAAVG
jgi:hypothetical protein